MSEEIHDDLEQENDDYGDDGDEEEMITSPVKRVMMVLFSPNHVYESLAKKSSYLDWFIPILITIAISLTFINIGYDYLRNDQLAAVKEKIEKNTKLSEQQKAEAIEKYTNSDFQKIGRVMANIFSPLGAFAGTAVIALVVLLITKFYLHGAIQFGDAFKLTALAGMSTVVASIVKGPLIVYHESFVQAKTSLGLLFPESMSDSFIIKLLDIDIFILWYVILLSIGMSVFAKVSTKKALIPIVVLWFVWRIAITALQTVFSGLGA